MGLGVKLGDLRRAKGESLQETADAVGTTKGHLWQLEKGNATKPAITLVQALADHFGVSIAYLVGEDLDAEDADPELVGMFRQASEFSPTEREILRNLMQTLHDQLKRRRQDGDEVSR
ncbi:helix-turn-helix transcriptional regulator [Parvularcula flava]|uniref:Helix-turn-helix transcriptional regulator n=1 Tax=Aquisalinus luteolus TaxID=1566827 RepID=A0A8J3ENX1_9PROT|nr:helix-turn-helix domain-containing protein [Aquisalinus luteolus]NHK26378.1 helix-turn-helix transcriptional regulator [Aquisalinus luteolus]GGH92154.1 hypothetical protein GCM10011355_00980 [Aquisalinus luteolus]